MKTGTSLLFSGMVCIFLRSLLLPASASAPPDSRLSNQEVNENVARAQKEQEIQENIGLAQTTLDQITLLLDFIEHRQHQKPESLVKPLPLQPILATDQTVLNVVLAEQVASNKEHNAGSTYYNPVKSYRVVLEIEMPRTPYPIDVWDQLYPQPEFAYRSQLAEAYRDVLRKNKSPVSWRAFQPATRDVLVADLRPMKAYLRSREMFFGGSSILLETLFSKARNYLSCWRPGYSADGQFALILYETPGAHGTNEGRYLLQKQGDKWKILLHQGFGPS